MKEARDNQNKLSPPRLNLGCGHQYLEGYINCDVRREVKADHYFDLDHPPYPFPDSSVDEILLDNVLEHLESIPAVMEEFDRLLAPAGRLRIYVPYGKSDWALQDPTHRHAFTENSMNYFNRDHPYGYYTNVHFHVRQARLIGHSTTWRHRLRNLLPCKSVLRFFLFNIYDVIYFELEK